MSNALITGASAGIGEAISRELHSKGYNLILVARRGENLKTICDELNSIRSDSARYCVQDLSTKEGVKATEDVIRSSDIDLLVNNVGRGSFGYFDKLDVDSEEELVRINTIVPLRLTHAAIPGLKKKGGGGIIFLSSITTFQPLPFLSTYAATKSFNFSQSLSLRAELKPFGINVLCVCPGPTATEFGGVARVPGSMTGVSRDTAQDVAREAIAAYERGSSYIVTGIRSKFLAFLSRTVPYSISTWLLSKEFRKLI